MNRAVAAFEKLGRGLSVASGLFVLAIIAIVIIDIAGRKLFNAPLPGGTVLATLLLVCVIFLGLARVQQAKEHYRVDLVANMLPARARRFIDAFAYVVSVVVVAILSKYAVTQAIGSFQRGEMSYDLVAFPIWPARIVLAAGLVLLDIQLLIDCVRSFRALASRPKDTAR